MNHKIRGIFGKAFFYTVIITVVVISTAAVFFAGQIGAVYETTQKQQLTHVFQPLRALTTYLKKGYSKEWIDQG